MALFRQGMRAPHDHAIRIAFAAALGRLKFSASPLDREPRSLLGCDREPVEFVLGLRAQLLKELEWHERERTAGLEMSKGDVAWPHLTFFDKNALST
ncbi:MULTISPECIES: hypothetical protein [unclassified Bradyrhizobium]|uniref:hypothetical protein n=1 Tax=unclassified Bradyrhizobium TaxID=2631580 RepID=UPI0033952EAD